jgi:diacylglycerol kinase (ATP)
VVAPYDEETAPAGGDHRPVTLPRLLQIAEGNRRFYGGGMAVAPQAGIDDGTLDVYAIEWGNWRDLLGVLRSFKSGHFVRHETVHYYQTACVRIDTARPLPTNVDGELVDQTPVLFSLARDASSSAAGAS